MSRSSCALLCAAGLVAGCAPYHEGVYDRLVADVSAETRMPVLPLPAVTPEISGEAPADATGDQREALYWVNHYRARAGLGPLTQLAPLNVAAKTHAAFLVEHAPLYDDPTLSVHVEVEGNANFLAKNFWDRMVKSGYQGKPFREVIAFQATPAAAVTHWIETIYHRIPLIHPAARHLGYATRAGNGMTVNVVDIGAGDGQEAAAIEGVAWPHDGARDVPVSWDGLETPVPPAPANGFPSGPVVSLTFPSGTTIQFDERRLRVAGTSAALDIVYLSSETDPHLKGESSVALYASAPLLPDTSYEVELIGTRNGAPFHRVWSFRTRASAGCDVGRQDCGPGKGCYGTRQADATCAWAGTGNDGQTCGFQNDCHAGLTCVNYLCRRYCLVGDPGELGCALRCPDTTSITDTASGIGVCRS